MTALSGELGAYLALVLVGFLPNEVWRWLAVIFSRGLGEDAEILIWVRAVATAILAGVIAKLTIFSPGMLATVPTPVRLGAVLIGSLAFILIRRSVFAGVLAGEAALIVGALVFGR
jgi:Branched-chain amino acid transport protein (AzlD)